MSWVALLCAAAVLLTAAWSGRRAPVTDRTVGEVTRVGVAAGDPIPGYLRAAAAELAGLADPSPPAPGSYALVSFSAYLTPRRAAVALAGLEAPAVVARVPLPGRQTEIVRIPAGRLPDDVVAGMAQVAERKDREAVDQRARAAAPAAAADPQLRRVYETGAQVAAAEADAYRSACACVYAAVVRGPADRLRALAARPGVRVVDPAPELVRLDRAVLTPPLPEQRDVARPPADDGLPGAAGGTTVGDSSEPAPTVSGPSPAPGGGVSSGAPPSTSPDVAGTGESTVRR
ncbi:hypothetical protein VK199_02360 [Micromonospora sp. CCTCC AA 2012012]|uniref:Uncharacterized protein n=1 Tax=Micromonospora sp. CCTCC AA 2012012 TaxID=3111921 RepID=A0AAU8HPD5_9ACTN